MTPAHKKEEQKLLRIFKKCRLKDPFDVTKLTDGHSMIITAAKTPGTMAITIRDTNKKIESWRDTSTTQTIAILRAALRKSHLPASQDSSEEQSQAPHEDPSQLTRIMMHISLIIWLTTVAITFIICYLALTPNH